MKANAFSIFAPDNLADVSRTPSLVFFVEKAFLLGVVGMWRPALVPLAVAAILVDRQGLPLLSQLAFGTPLRLSFCLLHLLLRGCLLSLLLAFVPTVLGVGGRVKIR